MYIFTKQYHNTFLNFYFCAASFFQITRHTKEDVMDTSNKNDLQFCVLLLILFVHCILSIFRQS